MGLQRQLLADLGALKTDAETFRLEWEREAPLLSALAPQEALNRVTHYQQTVLLRWTRFEFCAAGEALFGMPRTRMPQLATLLAGIGDVHEFFTLHAESSAEIEKHSALSWKEVQEALELLSEQHARFLARLAPLLGKESLQGLEALAASREAMEHVSGSLALISSLGKPSVRPRYDGRIVKEASTIVTGQRRWLSVC